MVQHAEDAPWTSARIHLGLEPAPPWLDTERFNARWPTPDHWRASLETLTYAEAAALRQATRHETALGSDSFINELELRYGVQLRAKPLGRPRKPASAESLRISHPAASLHAG